jgi:hypothetical protein
VFARTVSSRRSPFSSKRTRCSLAVLIFQVC